MPRTPSLTADLLFLEAALEGLEAQRKRIDEQINQVQGLLTKSRTNDHTSEPVLVRRRELSPAARKRIAAAQKKRWAEYRKAALVQAK